MCSRAAVGARYGRFVPPCGDAQYKLDVVAEYDAAATGGNLFSAEIRITTWSL